MKHYEIIIYWSEDDGRFIAEVPELSGCMADGKTRQEVLANAETVIDEWLETAVAEGREIPVPEGSHTHERLDQTARRRSEEPRGTGILCQVRLQPHNREHRLRRVRRGAKGQAGHAGP